MKPYKILEGDAQRLEAFEKLVADTLEEGYSLAGELIVSGAKLYQPMVLDESGDDEDEEWEVDEDWDDEEQEDYGS